MNLQPIDVQIPYSLVIALKSKIDTIPQEEFDAWVAWGVDMALTGNARPVRYMLGTMVVDNFGDLVPVNGGVL